RSTRQCARFVLSSRRRHTRSKRDWSSDVCSSDLLFGEIWSRNDLLSLRDRSIVTVVALMSQGLTDSSFKYHLETAKKNGVTRTRSEERRVGKKRRAERWRAMEQTKGTRRTIIAKR